MNQRTAAGAWPADAGDAASSAGQPGVYPLENAGRLPRRIPASVLRPSLDICKPTGVRWSQNSRVVVMSDQGGVAQALEQQLKKAGVISLLLPAGAESQELETQLRRWLAEGPIQGLYWLPALDVEPRPGTARRPGLERAQLPQGEGPAYPHALPVYHDLRARDIPGDGYPLRRPAWLLPRRLAPVHH